MASGFLLNQNLCKVHINYLFEMRYELNYQNEWVDKMLSAPPSQPAEESRHPRRCKKYQKMKIFPLLVQLSAPHHPTPSPLPARRPRNQPAELKSQYGKINAGLWARLMCTLEYDGTVNLNPGKFFLVLSRSLFHQDFQRKRKQIERQGCGSAFKGWWGIISHESSVYTRLIIFSQGRGFGDCSHNQGWCVCTSSRYIFCSSRYFLYIL